jgi:lysophospholipase L1-like esterase
MKKILFLLLITVASYGQTLQNPTFGKVKLKENITSTTAPKVNVQETDGTVNTISKQDLIDAIIVNTTAELTVGIGNINKLYATRDNTIIYRFNGTIYIPLVDPLTNASGLLEFNTTDRTVWSNGKGNITSNTVFGDSSLKSITTGGFNTAIGTNVLSNITTGNGNIGIGTDAGSPGNINSDSSIFIGVDARPAGSDQTNQIVIGAGGRGAGSNTVTLGNSSITSTNLFGAVNAGSFIKNSATSTNLLLAGGTDITQASLPVSTATQTALNLKEDISNKQNSLAVDGTGVKYPTVDAVNTSTINFNPKTTKIAFLGDSVTAGSGSIGGATSYADILNSFFGFQTYTKLGVSGATAKPINGIAQLSTQVSAIPAGTNFITVLIGVNDWSQNTTLGDVNSVLTKSYASLNQTLSFSEAFRFNLETIKRNFPDAKIRVILPIRHGSQWVRTIDFKFYIEAEIQIANFLNIPVINAFDASGLQKDSPYVPDGVHPNDTGYAMLSEVVKNGIIDNKTTRFDNSFNTLLIGSAFKFGNSDVFQVTGGSQITGRLTIGELFASSTSGRFIQITPSLAGSSPNIQGFLQGVGVDKFSLQALGGNVTVGTESDNAQGRLQVTGNITASPATLLNQVVTKAQTLYTNQTITANKTVTIAEFVNNNELVLRVSAAAGNVTVTLPTFTALQGYKVTVRKIDSSANSVTITGVGAINIDGAATLVVSGQYGKATIGADLVQYIIL